MAAYYVNKFSQPNGYHEVHKAGCFMPPSEDIVSLGNFTNCKEAIHAAHKKYRQVNACYTCSGTCYIG